MTKAFMNHNDTSEFSRPLIKTSSQNTVDMRMAQIYVGMQVEISPGLFSLVLLQIGCKFLVSSCPNFSILVCNTVGFVTKSAHILCALKDKGGD